MPTLTEDIKLPGNVNPATVKVTVELWGDDEPVTGFETTAGTSIAGPRRVTGNPWSVENLVGNEDIELPTGTVYRVHRTWPGLREPLVDYVTIPSGGGPFKVGDRLVDPPGSLLTAGATAAVAAQASRSALESLGAQVDQSTARTLEARFLQFIRDAGSGSPPAGWNYLGGDVPDCVYIPASNDALWIFADGFDGTTINASDQYVSAPLPIRNGAILEQTAGTFTNAIQIYRAGFSGLWMDAVVDGGHAANHIWWPIGLIDDGGVYKVACWLVESPAAAGEPHGRLVDSHIVTLGGFLTYGSHVQTGLGSLTDNFWVSRLWRDTTHTYVTGMQFVPPFDARTTAAPTTPNYVFDNPQNHHTLTRIARVANGSLGTVANWEYWTGSAWVAGVTNAQPMVDTAGNQIRGDSGIAKITSTHYVLAAHKLMDTHLDVYKAAAPQGPWTQISRVPLVTQGHNINGPNTYQVGQLVSILPTQVQAPPAEHRIAIISRNTIFNGYDAEDPFPSRNIRRYAPQFAVIPTI